MMIARIPTAAMAPSNVSTLFRSFSAIALVSSPIISHLPWKATPKLRKFSELAKKSQRISQV
jgi:hypothetical protein